MLQLSCRVLCNAAMLQCQNVRCWAPRGGVSDVYGEDSCRSEVDQFEALVSERGSSTLALQTATGTPLEWLAPGVQVVATRLQCRHLLARAASIKSHFHMSHSAHLSFVSMDHLRPTILSSRPPVVPSPQQT